MSDEDAMKLMHAGPGQKAARFGVHFCFANPPCIAMPRPLFLPTTIILLPSITICNIPGRRPERD